MANLGDKKTQQAMDRRIAGEEGSPAHAGEGGGAGANLLASKVRSMVGDAKDKGFEMSVHPQSGSHLGVRSYATAMAGESKTDHLSINPRTGFGTVILRNGNRYSFGGSSGNSFNSVVRDRFDPVPVGIKPN